MLRLSLGKGPLWIEIGPGVALEVLPASTRVMVEARQDPAVLELGGAALAEAADEAGAAALIAAEAGADDARPELALAIAQAVGRRVIVGWRGVLDDHGRPAPVSPEYIDALLEHPAAFFAFQQRYLAPALMLAAEKNGSAPSPSGTSAGAVTTARPVRRAARSAPTKSTDRKASRGR